MKLWQKVLIGFGLGMLLGMGLGPFKSLGFGFVFDGLKAGGSLFINLIKMLIVPLIFASLVTGITSMKDLQKMGRIGGKTFLIYLGTTAVAITIGLAVATIMQPGVGLSIESTATVATKEAPSFLDVLVNIVPKNPISSMADGNVLQVIFFAIVLGIAINLAGKKGEPASKFFASMAEVMYKLTDIVMALAPYGVFCLMAWVAGEFGAEVLLPLIKVIVALYIACSIHIFGVLGGIITFIAKLNPKRFFMGIIDAQLVAFTTTSSSGTLPVTMKCTEENLGVSNSVSSFVLPLGATINMDGTAIYQGVAALFVAQAAGIDLGVGHYITIVLTSTLASVGTAGVPGAGLILLSLVLGAVGLPMEGIALVAGIDRILDMARTTVNVTGDAMTSVLIAKSEKELNEKTYNALPTV